jgi:hypothetical protein
MFARAAVCWIAWLNPSINSLTTGNLFHGTHGTITDKQLKDAISPIRRMVTVQTKKQAKYGNRHSLTRDPSQCSGNQPQGEKIMGEVLSEAHVQWATRPADQRFWSLAALHDKMLQFKQNARVVSVDTHKLAVEARGDRGLVLSGESSKAGFTFGSFGQLCGLTGLPAGLMRDMPAPLVAQNMNWGLKERDTEDKATRCLVDTQTKTVRGFSSATYGRIWNSDITSRLMPLLGQGWRGAPARPCGDGDPLARQATAEDVLKNIMPGLGIKVGDMIAPSGFYGDADKMFVFMVNERATVRAGNVDLCKGFFITNAESPGMAEKITTFLYSGVCSNHIVWDATQIQRAKVVHKGNAQERAWRNLYRELDVYANQSVRDMESKIISAQNKELGKDKLEIIEVLSNRKIESKATIADAFEEAIRHPEDGHTSPRSVWGMVQGFTRLSQAQRHVDRRVELDQAASRVLALAALAN